MAKKILGYILAGSLSEGLTMRLDHAYSLEEIKTGKFVSIHGNQYSFFSLITDIELQVTNPDILLFPPGKEEQMGKFPPLAQ